MTVIAIVVAERILGLDVDLDRLALDLGLDDARGIGDRRQAAVGRLHPEVRRELGPALVHVGRAAAEVRLQAVEVRVGPVVDVDVLSLAEQITWLHCWSY